MCNNVHTALAVCHVGGILKRKTIAVIKMGFNYCHGSYKF
jgi:hypothetical protein